jgi:protocatechuate 3,4-dioxygenase beta subunit
MTQLKFYFSIFLVALTIAAQAQQSGIIKGRVLDSDNLSMPGAAVVIETINKGAITDNYGYYTISGIQEGIL